MTSHTLKFLPKTMAVRALLAVMAGVLVLPGPADAQFSKGYKFLEAVRKGDGQEVTDDLADPSATLINTRDASSGETALQIVTAKRDIAWMRFFIAKGADVNMRDNRGQAPLTVATSLGFAEGVRLLIEHGATVDQSNATGETPLITAVHQRDLPTIRVLLSGGANPDRTDNSGRSARDYAALFGQDNAIASLLDSAAKSRGKDGGGGTYGPSL